MDFIYDNNGSPYAFVYDNVLYYYILNLQGDVIRIVDTTGATICTYNYDAWGKVLNSSSNAIFKANPIRYRGYYYDSETGLYYLQSRYYDPTVKRFVNADGYASTGQGFVGYNMFGYCLNSPTSYADYSGHDAIYVTDYTSTTGLPIVGHSKVYLQDSDGTWYLTEFALHEYDTGKKITVECWKVQDEVVEPYLDGDVSFSNDYVYLQGDYSDSLTLARNYAGSDYGGYNLITNNCLDYVQEILQASTCNNPCAQRHIDSSKGFIPSQFGKNLGVSSFVGDILKAATRSRFKVSSAAPQKATPRFSR